MEETILIRAGGRRVDIEKAMKVRLAVFVEEQNVPLELEQDDQDATALHILAIDTVTNEAIGTARLIDRGDGIVKVGRVAVLSAYRSRGIGAALMRAAIKTARDLNFTTMILDSQVAVIPFYERLEFVAEGAEFQDAGIPHRRMTRKI